MIFQKIVSNLLQTGLTQQQLGAEAGCGQNAISKMYLGQTKNPRWKSVAGLLRVASDRNVDVIFQDGGYEIKITVRKLH